MTIQLPPRQLVLLGGFALAVAAAPAVAGVVGTADSNTPIPVAECPSGYVIDPHTGACVAGAEITAIPGNPDIPAINGIPCTGADTGKCIGLQESQGEG